MLKIYIEVFPHSVFHEFFLITGTSQGLGNLFLAPEYPAEDKPSPFSQ